MDRYGGVLLDWEPVEDGDDVMVRGGPGDDMSDKSLGPAGVYGGTFRGGQRGESCSFDTGADEAVDKVRGMRELSQSGVS